MLRLDINDSVKSFRASLQQWLQQQTIPTFQNHSLEEFVTVARSWQKLLAEQKWLGVHWPSEYGGRGLSLVEEAVVQEELARVSAPQILGLFGLSMVGPVLIKHGTAAQKKKFLPHILSAKEIWCQGFSEPNAGSDLANISTYAAQENDNFIVSGQKVWTSFAHVADWCFLLCRTSKEGPKHAGLSYLLVDMKSPGITVRPLRQMSGDYEFNEVFFDAVKVPKDNLVGAIGEGWQIALSTLMYERVILTFSRHLQSESALQELLNHPQAVAYQGKLADLISRTVVMRALAYEHLVSYAQGAQPSAEGSLDKLLWSETFQDIARLGLEMNKEDPASWHRYLYSRGRTIAAGTSEVQRNIIAERLLQMPRLHYSFGK